MAWKTQTRATGGTERRLFDGCVRLRLSFDAGRLEREIQALGAALWARPAARLGVHRDADAIFLRGQPPAIGDLRIDDRPELGDLPYARTVIDAFGAPPHRCLLARLPPGGVIPEHRDLGPYFEATVRIHVPVTSTPNVIMVCDGLSYVMAPGEAWALDNSAPHGVLNQDPRVARTHLICDFSPTPELNARLREADGGLGRRNAAAAQILEAERRRRAALRPSM